MGGQQARLPSLAGGEAAGVLGEQKVGWVSTAKGRG